jgi:hypothetical protein
MSGPFFIHAIKSSATTIGATQLAKTVALREKDMSSEAQPSYDDLSAELVKFISSCKALLDAGHDATSSKPQINSHKGIAPRPQ